MPPLREFLIYLFCLLPRIRHVAPHLPGREAHRHGERVDDDAKDSDDECVPAERYDPRTAPERAEVRDLRHAYEVRPQPRGPLHSRGLSDRFVARAMARSTKPRAIAIKSFQITVHPAQ